MTRFKLRPPTREFRSLLRFASKEYPKTGSLNRSFTAVIRRLR